MSVTAVPLRPVNKGGLWTLWIGLALLAAAAIGFAMWQTPRIGLDVIKEGSGPSPKAGDVVLVKYEGRLENGTVFDAAEQAPMEVNGVVPGFRDGLKKMKKGGKYKLQIPAALGYGAKGPTPELTNAAMTFDVELIDFKSMAEIQAMQQQMQQMQQMQGGPQGAPGGPPPGMPIR
ncbi:MAG: hypothetical protein RLZZ58_1765 [Pseudomonadota bacterium]